MQAVDSSQEQQRAIVGHAIRNPKFYRQCKQLGQVSLNLDPRVQSIWNGLETFYTKFKRHPSPKELQETCFDGQDKNGRDALVAAVKNALASASEISDAVVTESFRSLVVTQARQRGLERVLRLHETDGAAANEALAKTLQDIQRLTYAGLQTRTMTATERNKGLDAMLDAEAARGRVPFGIGYLDDAIHGMGPDELMIISAITGVGKTALMTLLAQNAIAKGMKVSFLALEAKGREIEARLRWQIVQRLYFADPNRDKSRPVEYDEWRQRRLRPQLDRYTNESNRIFEETYGENLRITYKDGLDQYTIEEMSADIEQEAQLSDLLLLDHIGYIDYGNQDNETMALKAIILRLRLLCNTFHIPIVAASHVKKETFHRNLLLPNFNDVYGSGEITKSADYVAMLGPATNAFADVIPEPLMPQYGAYTFLRLLKNRHAGHKAWPAAVLEYDIRKGVYSPKYAYGRFKKGDTVWEPRKPAYWAEGAWADENHSVLAMPLPCTEIEKAERASSKAKEVQWSGKKPE